jgi:hypothetical protein
VNEQARSETFDSPESVYNTCADLKLFNQEFLRVILLDARQRLITMIDVTKGSLSESLAYPRDIFRPVIVHSAYSFILAHNHPSGDPSPSEADLRLWSRPIEPTFDLAHLQAIHRHLLQDVYSWAGKLHTIDISTDETVFAPHSRIQPYAQTVFLQLAAERQTLAARILTVPLIQETA